VAVALAVLAGAWAAPSAADAARGREVNRPNTAVAIYLGESRGYDVLVEMPTPRIAVLYTLKLEDRKFENYVQSAYAVRVPSGVLKRGLVRARFPSLGRASLRFYPSGRRRVQPLPSHCRGKPTVIQYGRFRGTFSFEGEGGYFKREAHSAAGMLRRSSRSVCRKGEGRQGLGNSLWDYVAPGFEFGYSSSGGTISLLYAAADEGGRTIGIRAAHYEGAPPGAEIQLQALEWGRAGMAIGRAAFIDSRVPGTFVTSMPGVHPAFATLAPPAPFYGEGSYIESSSTSHGWTGTLGVSLPGLDLPLTGEQFKTSLCVVSPLRTPSGCDFAKPKPLVGARVGTPRLRWRHP